MSHLRRAVPLLCAFFLPTALCGAAESSLPSGAAERIGSLFAEWSGPDHPGCSVGVVRDGALVFGRGYGMANLELGVPLDARSVLDVGSVSKQLTAGAIALLAIEGRLGLDDDIRRFLPELAVTVPPVTIRHLLHHRGGLRDYTLLLTVAGADLADRTTTAEALALVTRQRGVDFPAGERFTYSNTGYFLLGEIVARASGMPLSRFARERFFEPLGMTSSHFHDDSTLIVPRRAQGYEAREGGGFQLAMSDWEQVGDGSVFTTLEDLARWVENLKSGKVGGARFVELMASRGLPVDDVESGTYGFAQFVTTWRGRDVWRHGGAWAGYRAHLLHVPEERLAVAILCNFAEARGLGFKADAVAAAALGEAPEVETPRPRPPASQEGAAAPAPLPAARLEPLAGRYWSDELAAACELAVRDGRLVWIGIDALPHPLDPQRAPHTFASPDGLQLRFTPGPQGTVDGFQLDVGESQGIGFRRIDDPAATLRIVNARLIDGTGAPARPGSLRIAGDRIVAVGDLEPLPGEAVFDAKGLVLAPGFIDTHSHAASDLLEIPEALGAVSQGITTVVGGQDGGSSHPLSDFFASLEKAPAAVNVASYAGHGTLREKVLGNDFRRTATADEIAAMSRLLERDMEAGALGLSSGLEYDPGIYSARGELIDLARVAARHGGRYISHIRSEDRTFWEAIDEILAIGREAKLPVQISHVKLAMQNLWGQAPRLLDLLAAARTQGIDVTADIYPYLYWHSSLTVLFPNRDFENLDVARQVLAEIAPPEGLLLGRYLPNPAYPGRTVADIAKERGEAPEVTLVALIRDAEALRRQGKEGVESVIATSMIDGDLDQLLAWPHTNLCTDGELDGRHPRGFGSYPRVLGRYVRERGVLDLEEAVHKMTALAADHVGIKDRGRLVPGAFADLVLFDPATVIDRATTTDPHALSAGIERVWVNGQTVYAGGATSGLRPGRVLRREGSPR